MIKVDLSDSLLVHVRGPTGASAIPVQRQSALSQGDNYHLPMSFDLVGVSTCKRDKDTAIRIPTMKKRF